MDIKAEIRKLSDIDDGEAGLLKVQEIARQIMGQDIILEIQETLLDEDGIHRGSCCLVLDFTKIEILWTGWRYISRILESVLLGLLDGKKEIHYEASHKYSFLDTFQPWEEEAVFVGEAGPRPYIYAYGDLCY